MKVTIYLIAATLAFAAMSVIAQTMRITFDQENAGESPEGFTTTLTGRGNPGVWVVLKDETAPSKGNVVAQTTFTEAGRVGLWTKADWVIHFDDLRISSLPVSEQEQRRGKESGQMPVIVFVCEHGAAKSIVAAAYFNRLAEQQHLDIRAFARGTNPDEQIAPKVAQGLQSDGLVPTESTPTKISKSDLAGALRVITFCALPDGYAGDVRVEHWNDELPLSEDYSKARDRLVERIQRLLGELKSER
jgi:arsenate reductase (thioredoxin)